VSKIKMFLGLCSGAFFGVKTTLPKDNREARLLLPNTIIECSASTYRMRCKS
jgi:hypothetical protein